MRAPARKLRAVSEAIDPRVDIGHVHLKVSDIDRALGFYRDVLGFDVMQRAGDERSRWENPRSSLNRRRRWPIDSGPVRCSFTVEGSNLCGFAALRQRMSETLLSTNGYGRFLEAALARGRKGGTACPVA